MIKFSTVWPFNLENQEAKDFEKDEGNLVADRILQIVRARVTSKANAGEHQKHDRI